MSERGPSQDPNQLHDQGLGLVHTPQNTHQDLVPDQGRDHLQEAALDQDLAAVDTVLKNADHIPDQDHQALTDEGM